MSKGTISINYKWERKHLPAPPVTQFGTYSKPDRLKQSSPSAQSASTLQPPSHRGHLLSAEQPLSLIVRESGNTTRLRLKQISLPYVSKEKKLVRRERY